MTSNLVIQKHSKFKRMRGCNCSSIIQNGSFIKLVAATGIANQLNTFQIPAKYTVYTKFVAASALLKETYPLRNGWPELLSWNKETLHSEKNCSLRLSAVTFQEIFFSGTTTLNCSLFLWAAISLEFLYICQ